jgi:hypothetical protein
MPGPSKLKMQRKLHLVQNNSTSGKIVNSVTKKIRQLQNDLISDIDQPTGNGHFTFKKLLFVGTSGQKLSNYLEQQNPDVDVDTNLEGESTSIQPLFGNVLCFDFFPAGSRKDSEKRYWSKKRTLL